MTPFIRVFMISTISIANQGFGLTNRTSATCWVAGHKSSVKYDPPEDVLSTIAHEIGHVLTGYDHPDDNGVFPDRVAPLLGTDRSVRLLCSHGNRSLQNGKFLVKAEWDEAEKWLRKEEIEGRMSP